jgi:putative toxin-antitoxin system antitoxin component (TIGR02293 family)
MLKGAKMTEPAEIPVSDSPQTAEKLSLSYADLFRASPIDRIDIIKAGLRAVDAKKIIADLDVAQGLAFSVLNLSGATVNRKAAKNETLPPSDSERVIGMARLMGQLEVMVEESGNPNGFDTGAWMSRWLKEPLPALGGTRPIDLLDTMEGQSLVSTALAQIQSAAYG